MCIRDRPVLIPYTTSPLDMISSTILRDSDMDLIEDLDSLTFVSKLVIETTSSMVNEFPSSTISVPLMLHLGHSFK